MLQLHGINVIKRWKVIMSIKKYLSILVCTLLLGANSIARSHSGHDGELPEASFPQVYYNSIFDDIRNLYTEPNANVQRQPINDLDNEIIDIFSGLLQLQYVDINVPANGLSIAAQRNYLGLQPHQFRRMTAMQRSVNGLGWQMHFGKLTASTFNNASLCDNPILDPVATLNSVIANMQALYEPGAIRALEELQANVQTVRDILSQRVMFSDQDLLSLEQAAIIGVHDLEETFDNFSNSESDLFEQEMFDLSDIVPGDDTNALMFFQFFSDVVRPLVLPYTTRDNIAFEYPSGGRNLFVRDDTLNDGSLISLNLLKLRCELNQMVVLAPDGTKYFMTEFENFIGQRGETEYEELLLWGEPSWYVSSIEDVNGNSISIAYGENILGIKYVTGVSSSDVNTLPISYTYTDINSPLIKLTSIQSGTKVWTYEYDTVDLSVADDLPKTFNVLSKVTRPDGRFFTYSYDQSTFQLTQVVSPYSLVVDYTYRNVDTLPNFPDITFDLKGYSAIASKTLTGPDIERASWAFQYSPGSVSAEGRSNNLDLTTIVGPYATKRYYHFGGDIVVLNSDNDTARIPDSAQGLVISVGTVPNDANDTARSSRLTTWSSAGNTISSQIYSPGISGTDYLGFSQNSIPVAGQGDTRLFRLSSNFVGEEVDPLDVESVSGRIFGVFYQNHDVYGLPQTVIDAASGNLISGTVNRVHQRTYQHDTDQWIIGLPQTSSASNGEGTLNISHSYDGNGQLIEATVAGVSTQYTYYGNGELQTITDMNGHITRYGEYSNGVPSSITNAEDEIIEYDVNDDGTVASVKDQRGNTTVYTYDNLDRVIEVDTPINASATISYPTDEYTRVSIRSGLVSIDRFDVRGRLIQTNADTIVTTFAYDLTNRSIFTSNPNSTLGVSNEYDAIDRIVKVTDPVKADTTYLYDGFSSVSRFNRRGRQSVFLYQRYGFQKLATSIIDIIDDSDIRRTNFTYNVNGQKISITQSLTDFVLSETQTTQTRFFTYDDNFYLSSRSDPETGLTRYTTDNVGNVTSLLVERVGKPTLFEYDNVNRLKQKDYPDGTDDIFYDYFENGLLKSTQTGLITNSYDYDENNNLREELMSIRGRFSRDYKLSYTYNDRDQIASIEYPNQLVVNYSPDVLGRPTSVGSFVSQVQYRPNGQLSSLMFGNGMTLGYDYDDRLLPSSISTPGVMNFSYDFDPEGNVSDIQNTIDPSHNVTFGSDAYDGIDRLNNAATSTVGDTLHDYDALGNLIGVSSDQGDVSYNSNGDNLRNVRSNSNATPDIALQYDGYGNVVNKKEFFKSDEDLVTSIRNNQYIYDDASRLLTVDFIDAAGQNPVEMRQYSYDGQNYRVISEVAGSYDINYSFYSLSGDLMYEESIDTCEQTANIRLGSMLIASYSDQAASPELDGDGDGLNDCIELVVGLNASDPDDASIDSDLDGLSNIDEIQIHFSLINQQDSDNDGVTDGVEITIGSNPNRLDSDRDGMDDGVEIAQQLNPTLPDTDHDGASDTIEQIALLDPLNPADGILDIDVDRFSNRQEALLGFDPNSSASTPPDHGLQEWVFDGIGKVFGAPAIDPDGISYYGTEAGNVYAVYPDGDLKWSYDTGEKIVASIVVDIKNNSVYVPQVGSGLINGILSGRLTTLDLNDGTLKILRATGIAGANFTSPALDPEGNFYAIDRTISSTRLSGNNGQLFWRTTLSNSSDLGTQMVISATGVIYVGDSDRNLTAIDSETGDIIWQTRLSADLSQAQPALANDGSIYIVSADSRLNQVDSNGNLVWSIRYMDLPASVYSPPIVAPNGTVYIGAANTTDNQLLAIDSTGSIIWTYDELFGPISTPAMAADGTIYVADSSGVLHAINSDGSSQWINAEYSTTTSASPTIAADGSIYLGFDDGLMNVYADNSQGPANGWSGLGNGGVNSSHQCQSPRVLYSYIDDADGDGLPDCFEFLNGLQVNNPVDGNVNSDEDSLTDGQEFQAGTNPLLPDTDGDGINDDVEILNGTNPLVQQPIVIIVEPVDGSVVSSSSLTFIGIATEFGGIDLSNDIVWSSPSLNGFSAEGGFFFPEFLGHLGNGASLTLTALTSGIHTITASVTDTQGRVGQVSIQVSVRVEGDRMIMIPILDYLLNSELEPTSPIQ